MKIDDNHDDQGFNVSVVPDADVLPEVKARMMLVNAVLAGADLTMVMTILTSLLIHAITMMVDGDDELTGDRVIDQITAGLRSAWLLHEKNGATEQ